MTRVLVLCCAICMIAVAVAHAEDTIDPPPPDLVKQAREAYERRDYVHARDLMLQAYQLEPRPELLFALGQVEFNLHHYKEAIEYYERFNATNPDAEQAALVQQAIGAARIELARPPPPPPPRPRPPPHHQWEIEDSGLVGLGGLAVAVGGGLVYYSQHLAGNHTGSLRAYDDRVGQAKAARLAAGGCFAAGAIAIGAALLHWRLHLVETTIEVHPIQGGAAFSLERPL